MSRKPGLGANVLIGGEIVENADEIVGRADHNDKAREMEKYMIPSAPSAKVFSWNNWIRIGEA